MTKLLILALAVALVPAAAAQADADSDPSGQSEPQRPASDIDDSDANAPTGFVVERVTVLDAALNDGRDPSEPVLHVEAIEPVPGAAEANGRDLDAPIDPSTRAPYDGPLYNGREGGAAPPVAASDASTTDDPAATKSGPDTGGELALSPVMPNPVRGRAAITFAVPADGAATVVVYDLTGRRVAVAFDDVVQAGAEVRVDLDLGGVAAGTYVAVLDTGGERVSRTFQVVR